MRKALALCLFASLSPLILAPWALAQPKLKMTESVVGRFGDPKDMRSFTISPDGNRVAILSRNADAKYSVSLDGQEGKPYEWIVAASLTFSADSKRLGYVVQQGGKMFTVVDGKEGAQYHEIPNSDIMFAPAGGRYAYFARTKAGAKAVLVIDEQPSKEFDQIGNVAFSPDGKRVAYGIAVGNKQSFVVDEKVGGEKEYERVAGNTFTWSPDSKRYAYVAVRDTDPSEDGQNLKVLVVTDGKEGKLYDQIARPQFTPDSKSLLYVCLQSNKTATPPTAKGILVTDEKEGKPYDLLVSESLRISPDSKRIAFIAADKAVSPDKVFYVIDGTQSALYDNLVKNAFHFSPDSKRIAFQAVRAKGAAFIINGIEGKEYTEIVAAQFSPDSNRFAYLARKEGGKSVAVIDGTEGPLFDGVASLTFSTDGKRMAYLGSREGKSFAIVDGIQGKDYLGGVLPQNVAFSPDGKYLAYEATNEKPAPGATPKILFGVIGADPAKPAEISEHAGSIRGGKLVWDSPTSFHCIVLKAVGDKREVVRVQVDVTP